MKEIVSAAGRLELWLEQQSLPLWADAGMDRVGGGFHESLGLDGRPTGEDRRARVQARQTYVYAAALKQRWGGHEKAAVWDAAVSEGLDYLWTRYRRRDGLFRTLVSAEGMPLEETALLYDQAFVLFALAAAYAVRPDQVSLLQDARDLLRCVMRTFSVPGRGLREASQARPFQSNPHMHLLEAALAWSDLDRSGPWPTLADQIAELCLSRFIDARTGALREFFDADWRAAPGPDGKIVEPGHQFEWAWLLSRWGLSRGRRDALAAAERLFEIGVRHGVDERRGVAVNALLDDFSPHDEGARLWPQTERLKAALILSETGALEKRSERRREALAAVGGLEPYLDLPLRGLWRDKLDPAGAFREEPASASSFYHIVCALAELKAYAARSAAGAPDRRALAGAD